MKHITSFLITALTLLAAPLVQAAPLLASQDCAMGSCAREFIVTMIPDKTSGLVFVRTTIEHYCNLSPRECAPIVAYFPTLPHEATYTIQCRTPGGYVEGPGRHVLEPDPNPPHSTRAAKQLWDTVCQPMMRGAPN
jgi:hypothetical protein